jgi:hypothetical protein
LHPTHSREKNIPKMFIVAGPRPRRAKRPARPSLPSRVSRGSTATARPAARARAERPPASTEVPVLSVSRPVFDGVELVLFLSRVLSDSNPNKDRTTGSGCLHPGRREFNSTTAPVSLTLPFPRIFPSARHRRDRMGRPPVRRGRRRTRAHSAHEHGQAPLPPQLRRRAARARAEIPRPLHRQKQDRRPAPSLTRASPPRVVDVAVTPRRVRAYEYVNKKTTECCHTSRDQCTCAYTRTVSY